MSSLEEPPAKIGRYTIVGIAGEGGFGRVYLGFDQELHRNVAIKVPTSTRAFTGEELKIFLAEGQILAKLKHSNIVPVFDIGTMEDGRYFIVSEFITGSNLGVLMKQQRLTYRDSVKLLVMLADALHYSHANGLVHRDVKPANILLDRDGRLYLADFGLALQVGDSHAPAGTPAYMSPEQARGERVDHRSDIFGLGAIMYELLTGNRAFSGPNLDAVLTNVMSATVCSPRRRDESIPPELERICLKALAKRPVDRYATAHEFSEDLLIFLESSRGRVDAIPISPAPGKIREREGMYFDNTTYASHVLDASLSQPKCERFARALKHREKLRQMTLPKEMLNEHLMLCDSRAAMVVMTEPVLIIAAYTDELDCVALLRFPQEFVDEYKLSPGSRLLTVNSYPYDNAGDLIPGPATELRYGNFHPIIAEFMSDDHEKIVKRKSEILNDEWFKVATLGNAAISKRVFHVRDGNPYLSMMPGQRVENGNISELDDCSHRSNAAATPSQFSITDKARDKVRRVMADNRLDQKETALQLIAVGHGHSLKFQSVHEIGRDCFRLHFDDFPLIAIPDDSAEMFEGIVLEFNEERGGFEFIAAQNFPTDVPLESRRIRLATQANMAPARPQFSITDIVRDVPKERLILYAIIAVGLGASLFIVYLMTLDGAMPPGRVFLVFVAGLLIFALCVRGWFEHEND